MEDRIYCEFSGYLEFSRCGDSVSLEFYGSQHVDIMANPSELKEFCLKIIKLCEEIENEH